MQSEIKENAVCERCKQYFICNPANIEACHCMKIQLSIEEMSYISKHYCNCVCNTCLLILKKNFMITNKDSVS